MPKPVYKPDSTTPRRGKDSTDARGNRVIGKSGSKKGGTGRGGLLEELESFVHTFIVLDPVKVFAIVAWVIAARLIMEFDRFPHLAIYSPQKRCGKTTLLLILEQIVPRPYNTANISPAAIYRLVDKERPTLIIDECSHYPSHERIRSQVQSAASFSTHQPAEVHSPSAAEEGTVRRSSNTVSTVQRL